MTKLTGQAPGDRTGPTRESRTQLTEPTGPQGDDFLVFHDGDVVPYSSVHLGLRTHAFSYGTACFEGMRAYWNESRRQLYLLQGAPHYDRLSRSARILRMALPYTEAELVAITCDLLRRNEFREDVFIRATLFKSGDDLPVQLIGIAQSLSIYAIPFGDYVDVQHGLRCSVSSWRRLSDQAIPARAKIAGSYVNSALAKTEALENGFDEAIVLTESGHVSEGSAENLFLVRGGTVSTPPATDDILEGITRRGVIELLRASLGMEVIERSIDRTELYTCDELFLCGSAAQVAAVIEVDHRPVGDGKVGALCKQLQEAYFAAVRGNDPRYEHWLAEVY